MSSLLPRCAIHISFISPRIRFWIINLLLSINSFYSLKNEKIFMKNILPHICLNRYLQVEGIKKNTMILWKEITALGGIEYIKSNYEDFLTCYLNELKTHGMIEREAACRCIQELIMKVYDEDTQTYTSTNSFFTVNTNCCCAIKCLADTYVEGV